MTATVEAPAILGPPATFSRIVLDKALAIPGWMHPVELVWLASEALTHRSILEIGSHLGRSTRALGDNTPGHVIAVDDFTGPRDTANNSRGDYLDAFVANMAGISHKVRALRCDFATVNPLGANPPFDMIFLDGAHDYDSVRRDINKWLPHLMPGGLICGHDFSDQCPGVQRAVNETFGDSVRIAFGVTSIWYIQ